VFKAHILCGGLVFKAHMLCGGGVTVSEEMPVGLRFENNYCTERCSGFEAGRYLRRMYFMYHSTFRLIYVKAHIFCVSLI